MHRAARDLEFMEMALRLARLGVGYTSPNPAVGAVVVRDGRVLGYGFHFGAGTPHAEIWALQRAGDQTAGATLYVTLEPCNHQGLTPPCTDAIRRAGIRRVVIGTRDPNRKVPGGGVERLRSAGVKVTLGVAEAPCQELIRGFLNLQQHHRPWTVVKVALSVDGRVAAPGRPIAITSAGAQSFVHHLRALSDAILVGTGTARIDRPQLTVRSATMTGTKPYLRCILDRRLRLPRDLPCMNPQTPVVVFHGENHRPPAPPPAHMRYVPIPETSTGLDLTRVWAWLADQGIQQLLVEPGPTLLQQLWNRGLIDEMFLIQAARVLGDRDHLGIAPRGLDPRSEMVWIDRWSLDKETVWHLRRRCDR